MSDYSVVVTDPSGEVKLDTSATSLFIQLYQQYQEDEYENQRLNALLHEKIRAGYYQDFLDNDAEYDRVHNPFGDYADVEQQIKFSEIVDRKNKRAQRRSMKLAKHSRKWKAKQSRKQ